MIKRMMFIGVCLLLAAFLVVENGAAMSSTNYRLEWYTPLTGGGGSARSANYAVEFTIGQSATGRVSSTTNQLCLGYWCGAIDWRIFLPLVVKN